MSPEEESTPDQQLSSPHQDSESHLASNQGGVCTMGSSKIQTISRGNVTKRTRQARSNKKSVHFAQTVLSLTISTVAPIFIAYHDILNGYTSEQLTTSLTNVLEREIYSFQEKKRTKMPSGSNLMARFFSVHAPTITLRDYINRFVTYLKCSRIHYLMALNYVERIGQKHIELVLSNLNVHRLFTAAMGVAIQQNCVMDEENCRKVSGLPSVRELRKTIDAFVLFIDRDTSISEHDVGRFFRKMDSMKDPASLPCDDNISELTSCEAKNEKPYAKLSDNTSNHEKLSERKD